MPQPRELTDGYRLEKMLASSRSASVLGGTHLATGRAVVIKLINLPAAPSPAAAAAAGDRFAEYAAALGRLRHPNLPVVYDSGLTPDGAAFLVMEPLTGVPFDSVALGLAPDTDDLSGTSDGSRGGAGASTSDRILPLLDQAVVGLEELARHGLAHWNISPANLLVVPTPRGEVVKLLGLATPLFYLGASWPEVDGARFRAPELTQPPAAALALAASVAAGIGSIDWHADCYSLALAACNTLGATVAFGDAAGPIVQMPLALSFELANDEALRRILEACLRPNPLTRPTHAAIRDAFRLALGGEPAASATDPRGTAIAPDPPAAPAARQTPQEAGQTDWRAALSRTQAPAQEPSWLGANVPPPPPPPRSVTAGIPILSAKDLPPLPGTPTDSLGGGVGAIPDLHSADRPSALRTVAPTGAMPVLPSAMPPAPGAAASPASPPAPRFSPTGGVPIIPPGELSAMPPGSLGAGQPMAAPNARPYAPTGGIPIIPPGPLPPGSPAAGMPPGQAAAQSNARPYAPTGGMPIIPPGSIPSGSPAVGMPPGQSSPQPNARPYAPTGSIPIIPPGSLPPGAPAAGMPSGQSSAQPNARPYAPTGGMPIIPPGSIPPGAPAAGMQPGQPATQPNARPYAPTGGMPIIPPGSIPSGASAAGTPPGQSSPQPNARPFTATGGVPIIPPGSIPPGSPAAGMPPGQSSPQPSARPYSPTGGMPVIPPGSIPQGAPPGGMQPGQPAAPNARPYTATGGVPIIPPGSIPPGSPAAGMQPGQPATQPNTRPYAPTGGIPIIPPGSIPPGAPAAGMPGGPAANAAGSESARRAAAGGAAPGPVPMVWDTPAGGHGGPGNLGGHDESLLDFSAVPPLLPELGSVPAAGGAADSSSSAREMAAALGIDLGAPRNVHFEDASTEPHPGWDVPAAAGAPANAPPAGGAPWNTPAGAPPHWGEPAAANGASGATDASNDEWNQPNFAGVADSGAAEPGAAGAAWNALSAAVPAALPEIPAALSGLTAAAAMPALHGTAAPGMPGGAAALGMPGGSGAAGIGMPGAGGAATPGFPDAGAAAHPVAARAAGPAQPPAAAAAAAEAAPHDMLSAVDDLLDSLPPPPPAPATAGAAPAARGGKAHAAPAAARGPAGPGAGVAVAAAGARQTPMEMLRGMPRTVLFGGAGAILLVIALTAAWLVLHHRAQPLPAEQEAGDGTPEAAAPPRQLGPSAAAKLAEAESYQIMGRDYDSRVRQGLHALTFADQAELGEAACGKIAAIEQTLAADALETVPQDLASGLRNGDLGTLQTVTEVASSRDVPSNLAADYERAKNLVALYSAAQAASARGDQAGVLDRFHAMESLSRTLHDPLDLRDKAAAALEADAAALARDGKYDEAIGALEPLRRNWPERAGVKDLVKTYESAAGSEKEQLAILDNVPTIERRRKPSEGLDLLRNVKPTPHLEQRIAEARQALEAQLAQLDAQPPQIALRDGYLLDYSRGQVVTLSFRVTDDYEVKSVKMFARPQGGSMRELSLRHEGLGYTVDIPPSFHQNDTVDFYVVASDLSGHEASLGSKEKPLQLRRRQGFERLIQ